MRVRPDHVRVHQRGAVPFAAIGDGGAQRLVGGQEVAAVHFLLKEARET